MSSKFLALILWSSLGTASLVGCAGSDDLPPTVSLTAPPVGSAVGGVVPVQVTARDGEGEVTEVRLFAQTPGDPEVRIGIGVAPLTPFVVNWNTATWPNLSVIALTAEARDDSGNLGTSEPVQVTVSNSNTTSLNYFAGFNLPTASEQPAARREGTPAVPTLGVVLPPAEERVHPRRTLLPAQVSQTLGRRLAVEWAWDPQSGARGYAIYLGGDAPLRPYLKQRGQQPDGTSLVQKYSKALEEPNGSAVRYGVVTVLTAQGEGSYSNAGQARFLAAQPGGSATVVAGRPRLSWPANPDPEAVGYLYFLYKNNPLSASEAALWSNPGGRSTARLNVDFPAGREALPSGTYHWWVAAVSFTSEGRPSGFSFSEPQPLVVP